MLLEKLRQDRQQAKLAGDTLRANLLVTLIAEATKVGKDDGNRETTDEEVLAVTRKFIKNLDETILMLEKIGRIPSQAQQEKELLLTYLPQQLSRSELKQQVEKLVADYPTRSPQLMGKIMASLKADFAGRYDARLASEIVKEVLSA